MWCGSPSFLGLAVFKYWEPVKSDVSECHLEPVMFHQDTVFDLVLFFLDNPIEKDQDSSVLIEERWLTFNCPQV